MKLEELGLPEATYKTIRTAIEMHGRHFGIRIGLVKKEGEKLVVRAEQIRSVGGRVYTVAELVTMAKKVFANIEGVTVHVAPIVLQKSGEEEINPDWVKAKLKEHGITQADLCREFAIDKGSMSRLLSGEYDFTRWHKVAFRLYFEGLPKL